MYIILMFCLNQIICIFFTVRNSEVTKAPIFVVSFLAVATSGIVSAVG